MFSCQGYACLDPYFATQQGRLIRVCEGTNGSTSSFSTESIPDEWIGFDIRVCEDPIFTWIARA